jgi:hypothetical protein
MMNDRHDRAYPRNSSIDFKGIAAAALASHAREYAEWRGRGRMDPLILLQRARDAGLRLEVADTSLKITGPKKAEPLVRFPAEHKAQVLEALRLANGDLQKIQEMQKIGPASPQDDLHLGTYSQAVAALRAECPAYVDAADWHQAIEDGAPFLAQWAEQAAALGWARDLFGLAEIPESPRPSYQRLSRYDQTGLVWLLRGGGLSSSLRPQQAPFPAAGPTSASLPEVQTCRD